MNMIYDQSEMMNNVIDIAKQIDEEANKDAVDNDKMTKLMFEQMLRGLYLQNVQMQ
jgi:hypothetical protein